jgi:threonine dehydrogenase-like Zn-dependent dehydrogenase
MSSVCGSDLHIFSGERLAFIASKEKPVLFGHEAVGQGIRLGRDVKTDLVGNPLKEETV